MTDLLAALLGLLAGIASAMFGVGGGLIFVPTLILLDKSPHVAVATSLAAMVPVIVMGSYRQTTYGAVRWRDASLIGIASVPTAYLADALSEDALRRAFGVLLLAVAVQMAVRALRAGGAEAREGPRTETPPA
jgi:uncharacterized membrane protein YfcA